MQKIKFRDLQHILRHKTGLMIVFLLSGGVTKRINLVKSSVLMIILLSLAGRSTAQLRDSRNLDNHDDKPYYFGIVLGYNSSHYNITHHPTSWPMIPS